MSKRVAWTHFDIEYSTLLSAFYQSHTTTLSIMAEMSTQEAGGVLADDLMRDRARQFVEFLDDDVRLRLERRDDF
jgi:hypothetical protein